MWGHRTQCAGDSGDVREMKPPIQACWILATAPPRPKQASLCTELWRPQNWPLVLLCPKDPHRGPPEGLTTGPRFQLKYSSRSQGASLHKGPCGLGQLTQAAATWWARARLFLSPSWPGAGPFRHPRPDTATVRCLALCTVVLEGGHSGSRMGHRPCSGAGRPLREPQAG